MNTEAVTPISTPAEIHSPPAPPSQVETNLQEVDLGYIIKVLDAKIASGLNSLTAWKEIAAEPPPGWEATVWAREIKVIIPPLSLLQKPDQLQSELFESSLKSGARANDPKIYQEMVKHGQGHDVPRFNRVLTPKKQLRKERRSEIIGILRSPEITLRFVDKGLSLRRAIMLSRWTSAHPNQRTSKRVASKKRALRRLHAGVEAALTALRGSMEKSVGLEVPWSIQLGPYRLTFEPKTPAETVPTS